MAESSSPDSLTLKILTPNGVVLDTPVESLQAESTEGMFGVLPRHQPLVTPLKPCVLVYKMASGQKKPVAIMGGMFYTDGKTATVLSPAAETVDSINKLRAEEARKRAETRLNQKSGDLDLQRAEAAFHRALIRLKATSFS